MELKDLFEANFETVSGLETEAWSAVAGEVVDSLSKHLGVKLNVTICDLPEPDDVQPGLSMSFQSDQLGTSALDVRLEGVAGVQSDRKSTRVVASVLLFVGPNRVSSSGIQHLELKLVLICGEPSWQGVWSIDEFGEFETVTDFGTLSRSSLLSN